MKKIITSLLIGFTLVAQSQAQTAAVVSTGNGYVNNVWYSFDNGDVATASATNWDIALAATISPGNGSLASSILFNPKSGTLFVSPDAVPSEDFEDLDTTGLNSTWVKLYNSDTSWALGAFNQPSTNFPDYGWGNYDFVNHTGINANRVFVIRSGTSPNFTYKKLYLSLSFASGGSYTLTYDKLDNSDLHTTPVAIPAYGTKNFVYYSLTNNAIVDREPSSSAWDVLFTQYVSRTELYSGSATQLLTGVLLNKGIKAAQANNVADRTTYDDVASQTFSSKINTIGWDWKIVNTGTFGYEVVTDTVYFVKLTNGDIWKLYFTGFTGTSAGGNYSFTKEKLSTVTGLFGGTEKTSLALYPNPAQAGQARVIYDAHSNNEAVLSVADLTGNVLYTETLPAAAGLTQHAFSTATLTTGLYIVSVQVNGGVLQQKLVIK